ncbi:hypothetical protein Hanom_Chr07g00636541 [Helianthus anomalus]
MSNTKLCKSYFQEASVKYNTPFFATATASVVANFTPSASSVNTSISASLVILRIP